MGKIYNVSAEISLVDFLAERFFNQYADSPEKLAEVLFLLPSARACRNLQEAFVRINGKNPTILPRIKPIFDTQDEDICLCDGSNVELKINPEIPPFYRQLAFTKMILATPDKWGLGKISTAQAYALAQNLAELIDLTDENELDFADITNIVRAEYAEHWQEILKLLAIITHYWPKISEQEKFTDSVKRRILMLKEQLKIWKNESPTQKIVVAGTTAGFPVVKELIKTVSELSCGEIFLYGVDMYLSENDWQKIDENHPQFELKELLDFLNLRRCDVENADKFEVSAKQRFVSELMRPAATTREWQKIVHNKFADKTFDFLKIVNCDDLRQEAYAVSLIMREALETEEKTVALVTSDRNLARRVISELKRWNIIADDSSGRPLHLTALGIYLRLIINVIEQNFSQVSLLALLKHPFTKCGLPTDEYKIMVYHIEQKWRNDKKLSDLTAQEENLLHKVYDILQPLHELWFSPMSDFAQMFEQHIAVAEKLADTDSKTGDKLIWRKEDGFAMSKFVAQFLAQANVLGTIKSNDYAELLTAVMAQQAVRVQFGQHPRIKIIGPIEARLHNFDITIIGEANEGSWPPAAQTDMWMSRPMKKEFGLPLPERAIGVCAADFAHLLHGKQVYITRAEKVDGAPSSKSRWLLRLETVLAANYADSAEKDVKSAYSFVYDKKYVGWAKNFERASEEEIKAHKISSPAPKPPLYARPHKLSAGKFSEWISNPYSIFAGYILRLYPLDKLDRPYGAADYGDFVHTLFLRFNNKYPAQYPPYGQAVAEMKNIMENLLDEWKITPEVSAFWRPKISAIIEWVVKTEEKIRPQLKILHNEISGETVWKTLNGEFVITARADRIEETLSGKINIVDYKTGSNIPSGKAVINGYAPQLPVEAIIAQNGGFAGVKKAEVASMSYWKVADKIVEIKDDDAVAAIENTTNRLKNLIEIFENENTPYYSRPNPSVVSSNTDYDHLSRYLEWSLKDSDSENAESDDFDAD